LGSGLDVWLKEFLDLSFTRLLIGDRCASLIFL
jgi:hypothetical protein